MFLFFLLKVAQHGWDPIVSHSFLKKQTNCLNFHFHFYFRQFLRFFWDSVILLKFPEDLSFNRNNIKLFPFFSSPLAPFLEYAIVTTTRNLIFFPLPLLPFSVAHPLRGSFSSQLSPIIFTFALVLWEQRVQPSTLPASFFSLLIFTAFEQCGNRCTVPLPHEPQGPKTGQENLTEGSR